MRTKHVAAVFFALLSFGVLRAGTPIEILLYPEGPQESNGLSGPEVFDADGRVKNVSVPRLFVYLPERDSNPTGQAIVVCPGGGYSHLAERAEGVAFAQWLNEEGIAVAVLRYRLPNGHSEIPLKDAQTALTIVRSHASEWGIDPHQVGIMGCSAGGHLAATATTHFTDSVNRPDFSILVYPVITFDDGNMHRGSRVRLLGERFDADQVNRYSNERWVTPQTPPTFLVHCTDDKTVSPQNSMLFFDALRRCGVTAELHIFPKGGHGWGFITEPDKLDAAYRSELKTLLLRWLNERRTGSTE